MFNISEIIQTVKQLIDVRVQLVKEEISEQLSTVFARVFLLVVLGTISVLVLLFASISFAFFLGEKLHSLSKGFFYVTIIYLIILILTYLLRDSQGFIDGFKSVVKAFIFKMKSEKKEE